MGKGDRKTKRGKVNMGSYGKRRPRKENQTAFVSRQVKPNTADTALDATKAKAPKAEKKATTKTDAKKAPAKKAAAKKPVAKTTTEKDKDNAKKE
ncbi:30S ribosomal protein THX [Cryomorpha ignava]|uniref:30S ribosomal protein THX n=1 Tax=Cryomorpha ignava TaxID=101383 RepID=A0A7K3WWW0_9FLAO|nr:30S ribosomal protein THX [Cryomorpha ignava]NEN25342.1 30S ribosomal protein THX [Cryomorpha ignava]